MEIFNNVKENEVDFADLKPGDCFRWGEDEDIYVKSEHEQEAVSLTCGYALQDMCGVRVIPIEAELHIVG